MLHKGIVALMILVMSVSSLEAADGKSSNSLMELFRGPSHGGSQPRTAHTGRAPAGVTHAVVEDADRQVPEIRQTSAQPPKPALQPAESVPQPTPREYAPDVPPASPFSRTKDHSDSEFDDTPQQNHPEARPQSYPSYQTTEGSYGDPYQFASGSNATAHGFAGSVSFPHSGSPATGGLSQGMHSGHHLINGGYIPGASGPYGAPVRSNLYPAPKPGIPQQVGGTAIVHQALQPHEMLYAHRYRAMYGPYYYKVHGGWIVTPFGVWSNENWKLQGTTVDVKYRSHISPFAKFHPPVIR